SLGAEKCHRPSEKTSRRCLHHLAVVRLCEGGQGRQQTPEQRRAEAFTGRFNWRVGTQPARYEWQLAVGLTGGRPVFHNLPGRSDWHLIRKSVGLIGGFGFSTASDTATSVGLGGGCQN